MTGSVLRSFMRRKGLFVVLLAAGPLHACAAGSELPSDDSGAFEAGLDDVVSKPDSKGGGPEDESDSSDAEAGADSAPDVHTKPDAGDDCIVGTMTYASGATNPANPCQSCLPAMSKTTWSDVADETVCSSGSCCSGVCVDEQTDTNECGKCGVVCPGVTNGTAACATGSCGIVCNSGYVLSGGACIVNPCVVTFPATTSTTGGPDAPGTLGAGGGGVRYQTGDYVEQALACPNTSITQLTVDFEMSDETSSYCTVGTLSWNVMVNGTLVGTYSWLGGSGLTTHTISQSYTFPAIADVGGSYTLEYIATSTVCFYGGSWNWIAGGSATMD